MASQQRKIPWLWIAVAVASVIVVIVGMVLIVFEWFFHQLRNTIDEWKEEAARCSCGQIAVHRDFLPDVDPDKAVYCSTCYYQRKSYMIEETTCAACAQDTECYCIDIGEDTAWYCADCYEIGKALASGYVVRTYETKEE